MIYLRGHLWLRLAKFVMHLWIKQGKFYNNRNKLIGQDGQEHALVKCSK